MRWLWLLLPTLASAGCQVTTATPSTFPSNGASLVIAGGPLRSFAADQAAAVESASACAPSGASPYALAWAEVIASDASGVCGLLQGGEEKAGRLTVRVLIAMPGPAGTAPALAAGDYPVLPAAGGGAGRWATLSVVASDGQCQLSPFPAVDGSVSLTEAGAGRLEGTVVARLASGGTVEGAFGVDLCAASLGGDACAGLPAAASPICVP